MNMSCPFCGDSKSNTRKARGYVYQGKGKLTYHCHNCGITGGVDKILKLLDPMLHDEYIKERFIKPEKVQMPIYHFEPPKFTSVEQLTSLAKVSTLSNTHPVTKWVESRKIPLDAYKRLYFTKTFMGWTNTLLPYKFDKKALENDEPRLVIPLVDNDRNLLGFQGRSFKKNSLLRYITIMLDEHHPKLFGWDFVDPEKKMYVVEGPIDSLFLPNCLASAGADLSSNLDVVCKDKLKFVLVFDREPRNADIGKRVLSCISKGYSVSLLPESMSGKDINEYILSGMSQQEVVDQIDKHTYSGLDAQLAFNMWKRW